MSQFSILAPEVTRGLAYRNNTLRTNVDAAGANITLSSNRGLVNPIGIVLQGVIPPTIFDHTRTQNIVATGALDSALRSLHELGTRAGVTGISLGTSTTYPGGIQFAGHGIYESNTDRYNALGKDAARAIDTAARQVLDLLPKK